MQGCNFSWFIRNSGFSGVRRARPCESSRSGLIFFSGYGGGVWTLSQNAMSVAVNIHLIIAVTHSAFSVSGIFLNIFHQLESWDPDLRSGVDGDWSMSQSDRKYFSASSPIRCHFSASAYIRWQSGRNYWKWQMLGFYCIKNIKLRVQIGKKNRLLFIV